MNTHTNLSSKECLAGEPVEETVSNLSDEIHSAGSPADENIIDLSDNLSIQLYDIKCLVICFKNLFKAVLESGENLDYIEPIINIIEDKIKQLDIDYDKIENYIYNSQLI
ncbi:hypothetical protein IJ818_00540 [bacterium]|nr:hypothetical protein [bacterium]